MSNYPSTGSSAEPRFEVCSITGYGEGVYGSLTTSFWISDRDYGFREVETFYSASRGRQRLAERLSLAEQRCAELNAENDAALHASCL